MVVLPTGSPKTDLSEAGAPDKKVRTPQLCKLPVASVFVILLAFYLIFHFSKSTIVCLQCLHERRMEVLAAVSHCHQAHNFLQAFQTSLASSLDTSNDFAYFCVKSSWCFATHGQSYIRPDHAVLDLPRDPAYLGGARPKVCILRQAQGKEGLLARQEVQSEACRFLLSLSLSHQPTL